ncbi:AAA family ATPase [Neobacillus sp. Marseille-QA0830]
MGKSSIGEAIVFCLFGMTKHGYKGYVKDYMQEGKNSMKVEMTLLVDQHEYIIVRTMNPKGTTSVHMNGHPAKEKEIIDLVGGYQPFIYCFFPDVFPEEDKSTARSFIISYILNQKDTFQEFEKETKRLVAQQKKVKSSATFYEGQLSILKKQFESMPEKTIESQPVPENMISRRNLMREDLEKINKGLEHYLKNGYQLQAKIKNGQEKLKEFEQAEQLLKDACPTCHQKLPIHQLENIRTLHSDKKKQIYNELEALEIQLETERGSYMELSQKKSLLEVEIKEWEDRFPSNQILAQDYRQVMEEIQKIEHQLQDLLAEKSVLSNQLKQIKHQLGQLANQNQVQINKQLIHTRFQLFKQLKSGELRPDFQITYKDRPYRILSNSEKIRCMLEIISVIYNELNITYPIFLDNLESITHLNPPDTQIITATVKKGMPLTLKIKDETRTA